MSSSATIVPYKEDTLKLARDAYRAEHAARQHDERLYKPTAFCVADPDAFVQAAAKLGYRPQVEGTEVVLYRPDSTEKAMVVDQAHCVVPEECRHEFLSVMQRYAVDKIVSHLSGPGQNVTAQQGRNGEYEIVASGRLTPNEPYSARIVCAKNAEILADVDMKGPACDKVIQRIADAVGSNQRDGRKKPAYYQGGQDERAKIR